MTGTKLTKTAVDNAAPRASSYFIWDRGLKGFGLLVLPSGVRSFVYQYRNAGGATRRMTLGKFGRITPTLARRKAEDLRRQVAEGRDPADEKKTARSAATVDDIIDAYLDSQAFAAKADSTKTTDRGRIARHLRPLLGKVKADALTAEAVKRAQAAICEGKTAKREKMGHRALARVRGGEGAARKSVRLLSTILSWAKAENMVENNPVAGLKLGQDGTRDTILDSPEAYGRLFQTLDRMETERRIRQPIADAIRVIALTGARRGEVAGMLWRHVDLKAGTVTIDKHKTARSTGKPRVIGLPAAAAAIIARQPEGGPEEYVFAPAHGAGPVNLSKPWTAIRAEADLPAGLGLHGLRHSLASHMAMQGAQASEIMTALGHRNLSTAQRYVHWAQDARQAIAEKAAAVALAGMAGAQAADVVPIKGAKK